METIELFCGTKSFSKVAEELGHKTLTIDNNPKFNPDVCIDILNFHSKLPVLYYKEIFWASPPCTAFSVSSISHHWIKKGDLYIPKDPGAQEGLKLLETTIKIISIMKPKFWFIENPRGMMRKIIDDIFKKYQILDYKRVTISYCQYGDSRMKPTDIWTNLNAWIPKKICLPGSSCHQRQPRSYKAKKEQGVLKLGTQGLKNAEERGKIPPALFFEIFKIIEVKL